MKGESDNNRNKIVEENGRRKDERLKVLLFLAEVVVMNEAATDGVGG
jgi:hypothetical protein